VILRLFLMLGWVVCRVGRILSTFEDCRHVLVDSGLTLIFTSIVGNSVSFQKVDGADLNAIAQVKVA
jgi:hypothetical protein